jgi:stage III sporulation protein AA
MDKLLLEKFYYTISYLPITTQKYLKKINVDVILNIQEIRIRSNRPIVIVTNTGCHFLNVTGKLCYILSSNCVSSSENDVLECINKMCGYSMHNHYEDILNGYITLPNGSRVGLTGTAIFDKNDVKGLKDIDGINIRIPRQIKGVSELLFNTILYS